MQSGWRARCTRQCWDPEVNKDGLFNTSWIAFQGIDKNEDCETPFRFAIQANQTKPTKATSPARNLSTGWYAVFSNDFSFVN